MVLVDKNMTSVNFNRNFRVKVYGVDKNGNKINKLVGFKGFLELVGKLAEKIFTKACSRMNEDNFIYKAIRGLKITFYAK